MCDEYNPGSDMIRRSLSSTPWGKGIHSMGVFLFLAVAVFLTPGQSSAEVYKYVNKDGVVSYTDSLQAVPEKYRSKATVVKGLREQEEKPADKTSSTPTTSAAKPDAQPVPQQKDRVPVKQQLEKKIQDFSEKGYWKPILIILAFIAVFFLMGKASDTIGHKGLWTALRFLVVLGLLAYFFYAYTKEMSGVYSSLSEQVKTLKGTIDKKHTKENNLEKEMFPDNKKQGDRK
ncbi:MAG: hypothetical protein C0402_02690 [Thermodesulfovibrio sp.]|nr:hypothetical protein [Thermodesulfovibrio sp.]